MNAASPYTVSYRLEFPDARAMTYEVHIDSSTLISRVKADTVPPAWAKLGFAQCSGCPLTNSEYCPVALRLAEPLKQFGGLTSHTPVVTEVLTKERTYRHAGDVQEALRSLFGLIMATSGCPVMRPFRYMARYHLPFSTLEETVCRITSAYLMHQLFTEDAPKTNEEVLKDIEKLFSNMEALNHGMATRLKGAAEGDGMMNAVVILSTFSSLIPIIIREELSKLRPLFE